MQIQVILQENVKNLGQKGQAVNVKRGYFMNFLLPQNLASFATKGKLIEAAEVEKQVQAKLAEAKKEAQAKYEQINGKTLKLSSKVTKKGKLYAKVSQNKIAELILTEYNLSVGPNNIKISQDIKEAGVHESIAVNLGSSITAMVKLNVTAEANE